MVDDHDDDNVEIISVWFNFDYYENDFRVCGATEQKIMGKVIICKFGCNSWNKNKYISL